MTHGTVYYSFYDAADIAENNGLIVTERCESCAGWHLTDAKTAKEMDESGSMYRHMIAEKYPELAMRRGWFRA